MNKKIYTIFGIFLVLTILFTSSVFAFAVSSSYWKGKPVIAYPGKTITVNAMRLQNTETNDELVMAEVIKGSEVVSLEETDYVLKAGTTNNPVILNINIPEETEYETTFPVILSFKTVTPGNAGGVAVGIGYSTSFDVKVSPEPPELKEEPKKSNLILILSIIALITIVIILIIRKRKQKEIQ